jgi:hypothetical protein
MEYPDSHSTVLEKWRDFYSVFKKTAYPPLENAGLEHLQRMPDSIFGPGRFVNTLRRTNPEHPIPYSEFRLYSDLDFITQDLKYYIGLLTIMAPHINNPRADFNTYRQTEEDHIYLRTAGSGFQALYNFWDRLGDLLYAYFPTGLKERDVYWDRAMECIPDKYKKTPEYLGLREHFEKKVKNKIHIRKEIVHYLQLETKHYWAHSEHYEDPSKQREFHEEKVGYLEDLKEQLICAFQGYEMVLQLISLLPPK